MRIGIGLGHASDPAQAAADAARQASAGAPDPDLSFAFGHIRLDQGAVKRRIAVKGKKAPVTAWETK